MFSLIGFLWFIRQTKATLFYLYLWQLKEYHIGRFLDHFRNEKGKNLLLNYLNLFKIFLVALYFYYPLLVMFLVIFLYFIGGINTFFNFLKNQIRRPVLTKKAVFLILAVLISEIIFIFTIFYNTKDDIVQFSFWLLILDILTPLMVYLALIFSRFLTVFFNKHKLKR